MSSFFKQNFKKLSTLPPLKKSQKIQKLVSKTIHFSYNKKEDILQDLQDEIKELSNELDNYDNKKDNKKRILEELGDVFFVLGNLANQYNIDSQVALNSSINEYKRRILFCEKHFNGNFKKITQNEMIKLWKKAKENKK